MLTFKKKNGRQLPWNMTSILGISGNEQNLFYNSCMSNLAYIKTILKILKRWKTISVEAGNEQNLLSNICRSTLVEIRTSIQDNATSWKL